MEAVEKRMKERREHIVRVCRKHAAHEDNHDGCSYRSKDCSFDQEVGDHFLRDPNTGTVYCFIHKVG